MPTTDQHCLDAWTVVHHLYGAYFFSLFNLTVWEVMSIAVAWEIFESTPLGIALWNDDRYTGDSLCHAAVDVVATMSGWYIAWQLK